MGRYKLSASIIAKNEEDKIADCIASLSFADEIVVVDSGSTDRTVEVALSKGAKVVYNEWAGYVGQKNFAMDQSTGDWTLHIDADERVSKRLREEVLLALENPVADAYTMPRLVYYINRWILHCGWYPARKARLVRKGAGRWGGENPHDSLFVNGRVGALHGDIYHLSFNDISEHLRTINSFTDIAAAERYAKDVRAGFLSITLRPLGTFMKMYFFKLGFLDGIPGLIISSLSAYHVFCKYVKLREIAGRR